jgi:hypothetical protein
MEKYVTEFMITENDDSFSTGVVKNIVESEMGYGNYSQKFLIFCFIVVNNQDVKSNLLFLIQSLGEYLTHEDDSIRSKGRQENFEI